MDKLLLENKIKYIKLEVLKPFIFNLYKKMNLYIYKLLNKTLNNII